LVDIVDGGEVLQYVRQCEEDVLDVNSKAVLGFEVFHVNSSHISKDFDY
jgi:hypothetical protein